MFRDVTIIGGFVLLQTLAAPRKFDPLYISKLNTLVQISLVSYVLGRLGLGFADGIVTQPGDVFEVDLPALGAPLENPLARVAGGFAPGGVRTL